MTGQRPEPRYVLNVNEFDADVLHRDPREECNLDDADGRQTIDAHTADALLSKNQAQPCRHCWPDE